MSEFRPGCDWSATIWRRSASPLGAAEPLAVEAATKNNSQYQGLPLLFCRAALPLSSRTLSFVTGVIRRYRRSIGSCLRKLKPGQRALLVLAYLKKG